MSYNERENFNELIELIYHDYPHVDSEFLSEKMRKCLNEALYTASECGFFDCEELREDDALKAWLIVQFAMKAEYIDDYDDVINKIRM